MASSHMAVVAARAQMTRPKTKLSTVRSFPRKFFPSTVTPK